MDLLLAGRNDAGRAFIFFRCASCDHSMPHTPGANAARATKSNPFSKGMTSLQPTTAYEERIMISTCQMFDVQARANRRQSPANRAVNMCRPSLPPIRTASDELDFTSRPYKTETPKASYQLERQPDSEPARPDLRLIHDGATASTSRLRAGRLGRS